MDKVKSIKLGKYVCAHAHVCIHMCACACVCVFVLTEVRENLDAHHLFYVKPASSFYFPPSVEVV